MISDPTLMMDATLERALDEVAGYLELGMPANGAEILDELPYGLQNHPEVLATRFTVLNASEQWAEAARVARGLTDFMAEEPQYWIWWAFATRRAESVEAAEEILDDAAEHHPEVAATSSVSAFGANAVTSPAR